MCIAQWSVLAMSTISNEFYCFHSAMNVHNPLCSFSLSFIQISDGCLSFNSDPEKRIYSFSVFFFFLAISSWLVADFSTLV